MRFNFTLCAFSFALLLYHIFSIDIIHYDVPNSWNTISIAMMAKASAKTRAIIIAVNILGALEVFRPKAWIPAKEPAAKTRQGPNTQTIKIKIKERLRLILIG